MKNSVKICAFFMLFIASLSTNLDAYIKRNDLSHGFVKDTHECVGSNLERFYKYIENDFDAEKAQAQEFQNTQKNLDKVFHVFEISAHNNMKDAPKETKEKLQKKLKKDQERHGNIKKSLEKKRQQYKPRNA